MMFRLRPLISSITRAQPLLMKKLQSPQGSFRRMMSHDENPAPYSNMPFGCPNRYVATLFFGVFFGLGLWAPFIIVWYSMAKRTL